MRRLTLALLLGCLLLVAGASALDGYDYYQTIEYAACDQEIYQQDIVIHRTTGTAYNETAGGLETWHIYVGEHCREDYGDVRFVNSTGGLAYYLWPDYTSSSARFCVRLEGADAAGVLQVWYGNPSATTTSDGDATYLFYEDFEGTSTSGSGGTVTDVNSQSGSKSYMKTDGQTALFTLPNAISQDVIVDHHVYLTSRGYSDRRYFYYLNSDSVQVAYDIQRVSGGGLNGDGTIFNGQTNSNRSIPVNTWCLIRLILKFSAGTGDLSAYLPDGSQVYSFSDCSLYAGAKNIKYLKNQKQADGNTASPIYYDNIIIRAYSATPPAPTTFSGEQETATPPIPTRPRATATIDNVSTSLVDDLIDSLGGETVPEPGNDTINWTGLISTIGGAYTSILGPLAYTLIFSIPFLMMWITQRDMTLPGLVGALFGLFIIVRLPAEFHLVAVTFIVISIVAVVYSLVKERV